mmetsp:Transcript_10571/g.19068  ORF Transcript_10571/g.19068 Transcript_10571/m.19068 type:complete len:702 (-) Transcript_10571:522-2627(-)
MSLIVREPDDCSFRIGNGSLGSTKLVRMYTKGADSIILKRIAAGQSAEAKRIEEMADAFAAEGLRTLVMGYRDLEEDYFLEWLDRLATVNTTLLGSEREDAILSLEDELEQELLLLGCTGIEDKLQENVPETLIRLRLAGIKLWVLTGDKQGTAINIALSCGILDESYEVSIINETAEDDVSAQIEKTIGTWRARFLLHQEAEMIQSNENSTTDANDFARIEGRSKFALVIDGYTLTFALSEPIRNRLMVLSRMASSVILCRVSPKQKREVVEMVREYESSKITLAIGDGSNDVGMIQAAHVGIGVRGKEGVEAVLASDFAISRFYYLQRLLLVHGRWNLKRLVKLVLGAMYAATIIVFGDFYFGFFNKFSAFPLQDPLLYGLCSILLTPAPLLILGFWDVDFKAEYCLDFPELYRKTQSRRLMRYRRYLWWIFCAVWQEAVVFFSVYLGFGAIEFTSVSSDGKGQQISSFALVVLMLTLLVIHAHLALYIGAWNWFTALIWILSTTLFFWVALAFSSPLIASTLSPSYILAAHDTWSLAQSWFLFLVVPVLCILPTLSLRYLRRNYSPGLAQLIAEFTGKQLSRNALGLPKIEAPEHKKLPVFSKNEKSVKPTELFVYDDHGGSKTGTVRSQFQPDYSKIRKKQLKRHGSDGDLAGTATAITFAGDTPQASNEKHRRNKSDGYALLGNNRTLDELMAMDI